MNRKLESPTLGADWYSGSNRNERANGKDEIDLFELLVNGLSLIDRYRKLIVFLSVFSVCLGVVGFILTPVHHDGQLTIQAPGLEKSVIKQLLLAISTQEGRSAGLEGLKSLTLDDGETTNKMFIISASVNDPALLPVLQKVIVQYFESNQFVHSVTRQEKHRIGNTIQALRQEEQRLDSVIDQAILIQDPRVEVQSVAELSKLKMDFYRERLSLENQLGNVAPLQIIQGFSNTVRPAGKSLILYMAASVAGAFVLAAVIILVAEVRSVIRKNKYLLSNPAL